MTILTDEEKVRVRHHLGYLNVQEAQTFNYGIPAGVQTQFSIESAMDKILPQSAGLVREHLCILDGIERQAIGAYELVETSEVGDIKIDPEMHRKLFGTHGYMRWRASLANLFGVMPNPYDFRFVGMSGGVNAPVRHG